MNRMRLLTRRPVVGQDIAPEVKLTLFRDLLDATGENPEFSGILDAIIPLFINKDPSNPVPE
ncbi:MAG: hypothetical protein IT368_12435 [Candidatus Hydrogenedentes bacterium]|nr:hypothetical protein [Candidatus Hydrogenedentota bacterium]